MSRGFAMLEAGDDDGCLPAGRQCRRVWGIVLEL